MTDRDWREFVSLRERARQRFAEETLARLLRVSLDESLSVGERERRVFSLSDERRREQSALFGDFCRETASFRLHMMVRQRLLKRRELDHLSLEIRRAVGLVD